MDNWTEGPENVDGKQVDDAAALTAATEAAREDTVEDPKRLSAKSLEISVLYDAPGKEEASKTKVRWCVPGRGFCCFLGFVFMLLCILTGWYVNHSKLDQLKQQLSSMEGNNMLLEKLVETVQLPRRHVDYLLQQDQELRERVNAVDKANAATRVRRNTSRQIDGLLLHYQHVNTTVNLLIEQLTAVKRAVQDRQELLSQKLEEQLDTLYANFCGTPEQRGQPLKCCKEGWEKRDSHCYWLSAKIKEWEDAKKDCMAKNSHLVRIDDFEEQRFLTHFINKKYGDPELFLPANNLIKPSGGDKRRKVIPVWIGLSDSEREDQFEWVDGHPLATPTFWREREPNNMAQIYSDNRYIDSDCVVIRFDPNSQDLYNNWDDQLCRGKRLFVCRACIFCSPSNQANVAQTKAKKKQARSAARTVRQVARRPRRAASHPTCGQSPPNSAAAFGDYFS